MNLPLRASRFFPTEFVLFCYLILPATGFLPLQPFESFSPIISSWKRTHHGGAGELVSKRFKTTNQEGEEPLLPKKNNGEKEVSRRHFFLAGPVALASSSSFFSLLFVQPSRSHARGLVRFPIDDPKQLLNTYHFMRVGETLLEEEDIWSTNPLFLTNREAALTPNGAEQVQEACFQMEKAQRTPSVVKYSLAASCIDTANIIGDTLNLGRDRLVPEFTFLDPRGIGMWEQSSYRQTMPAVWALDALEAGETGTGGRPPANQDGTPNETLADQSVRLRQIMSVLETQYSGETILLIFPDCTGPALLSCMIAGIPYNRVHELEFRSGELRMDVTKKNVLQFWNEIDRSARDEYAETLQKGQTELKRLRTGKDVVNLKDQKIEAQRVAIDKEYYEKEGLRLQKEDDVRESRLERLRRGEENRLAHSKSGIPLGALGAAGAIAAAGFFASSGDEGGSRANSRADSKVEDVEDESTDMTASNTLPFMETSERPDLFEKPAETPIDPYKAAEEAMQEYLDRDDGAEDWLTVMTEIIEEEEDQADESENPQAIGNKTSTERLQ